MFVIESHAPGFLLSHAIHGCWEQTHNICITFVQCWTNVKDVGPRLYKCYTNVMLTIWLYKDKRRGLGIEISPWVLKYQMWISIYL